MDKKGYEKIAAKQLAQLEEFILEGSEDINLIFSNILQALEDFVEIQKEIKELDKNS